MTPEQMLDVFANTKGSDQMAYMIAVGEAIAAAARAEAIEQAAKLMNPYDEEGTLGALNAASIRAMLNTGEKT